MEIEIVDRCYQWKVPDFFSNLIFQQGHVKLALVAGQHVFVVADQLSAKADQEQENKQQSVFFPRLVNNDLYADSFKNRNVFGLSQWFEEEIALYRLVIDIRYIEVW